MKVRQIIRKAVIDNDFHDADAVRLVKVGPGPWLMFPIKRRFAGEAVLVSGLPDDGNAIVQDLGAGCGGDGDTTSVVVIDMDDVWS